MFVILAYTDVAISGRFEFAPQDFTGDLHNPGSCKMLDELEAEMYKLG